MSMNTSSSESDSSEFMMDSVSVCNGYASTSQQSYSRPESTDSADQHSNWKTVYYDEPTRLSGCCLICNYEVVDIKYHRETIHCIHDCEFKKIKGRKVLELTENKLLRAEKCEKCKGVYYLHLFRNHLCIADETDPSTIDERQ
ncbi:Hypothetical predicted protein [Cloeon dipterum]|uniref:Uncharacterized protein n=1 Tax=Cloeon dipterum TaxID=197152 RepID=A0A8S1E4B0_9INSE|nr:Hypothetical predicted protein [Cloeon dipterum]